jgi:molybdopterin-guanine dinucleotide biosynthesis protein MobB
MSNIPVICIVSAVSNTGKTTLMEKLIREIVWRGYKVGAVKSDCHGFEMDVPGKDSWRFAQAGARATAIVGVEQYALVQKTSQKKNLDEVVALMEDIDIALVEGFKLTGKPKIEVVRRDKGTYIVSPTEELIAVVTDVTDVASPVPTFGLEDYAKLADLIVNTFIKKDM